MFCINQLLFVHLASSAFPGEKIPCEVQPKVVKESIQLVADKNKDAFSSSHVSVDIFEIYFLFLGSFISR